MVACSSVHYFVDSGYVESCSSSLLCGSGVHRSGTSGGRIRIRRRWVIEAGEGQRDLVECIALRFSQCRPDPQKFAKSRIECVGFCVAISSNLRFFRVLRGVFESHRLHSRLVHHIAHNRMPRQNRGIFLRLLRRLPLCATGRVHLLEDLSFFPPLRTRTKIRTLLVLLGASRRIPPESGEPISSALPQSQPRHHRLIHRGSN